MWRQFEYHEPETLEEVLALLDRYGEDGRLLAGGTALLKLLKLRIARPPHLINLKRAKGLRFVRRREDGGFRVGALATYRDLEGRAGEVLPLLCEVSREIGSVQVRAVATVGGGLALAESSSDFAPSAIALGASVRVASKGRGEREEPLEGFYQGYFETTLRPDELLLELSVPRVPPACGWAYERICLRKGFDIAIAGVAALLERGDGRVKGARLCVGAATPVPQRLASAEEGLKGKAPTSALLDGLAKEAVADLQTVEDPRASSGYRKEMVKVLMRRAVERAWARALEAGRKAP